MSARSEVYTRYIPGIYLVISRPGIYLVYTWYIPTATPKHIPGIYLVCTRYMYSESLRYIPGLYLVYTYLLHFEFDSCR